MGEVRETLRLFWEETMVDHCSEASLVFQFLATVGLLRPWAEDVRGFSAGIGPHSAGILLAVSYPRSRPDLHRHL